MCELPKNGRGLEIRNEQVEIYLIRKVLGIHRINIPFFLLFAGAAQWTSGSGGPALYLSFSSEVERIIVE